MRCNMDFSAAAADAAAADLSADSLHVNASAAGRGGDRADRSRVIRAGNQDAGGVTAERPASDHRAGVAVAVLQLDAGRAVLDSGSRNVGLAVASDVDADGHAGDRQAGGVAAGRVAEQNARGCAVAGNRASAALSRDDLAGARNDDALLDADRFDRADPGGVARAGDEDADVVVLEVAAGTCAGDRVATGRMIFELDAGGVIRDCGVGEDGRPVALDIHANRRAGNSRPILNRYALPGIDLHAGRAVADCRAAAGDP